MEGLLRPTLIWSDRANGGQKLVPPHSAGGFPSAATLPFYSPKWLVLASWNISRLLTFAPHSTSYSLSLWKVKYNFYKNDGHGSDAVFSWSFDGSSSSLSTSDAAASSSPSTNVSQWSQESSPSFWRCCNARWTTGSHQEAHECLYGLVQAPTSQDRSGQPKDAQLGDL